MALAPPTGALRPPVAVGQLDYDTQCGSRAALSNAGRSSSNRTNPAFNTGAWDGDDSPFGSPTHGFKPPEACGGWAAAEVGFNLDTGMFPRGPIDTNSIDYMDRGGSAAIRESHGFDAPSWDPGPAFREPTNLVDTGQINPVDYVPCGAHADPLEMFFHGRNPRTADTLPASPGLAHRETSHQTFPPAGRREEPRAASPARMVPMAEIKRSGASPHRASGVLAPSLPRPDELATGGINFSSQAKHSQSNALGVSWKARSPAEQRIAGPSSKEEVRIPIQLPPPAEPPELRIPVGVCAHLPPNLGPRPPLPAPQALPMQEVRVPLGPHGWSPPEMGPPEVHIPIRPGASLPAHKMHMPRPPPSHPQAFAQEELRIPMAVPGGRPARGSAHEVHVPLHPGAELPAALRHQMQHMQHIHFPGGPRPRVSRSLEPLPLVDRLPGDALVDMIPPSAYALDGFHRPGPPQPVPHLPQQHMPQQQMPVAVVESPELPSVPPRMELARRPQAPPPPAPLPPSSKEKVVRPYIIEVLVDEVELDGDMEAAWYESTSYFLSMHPSSEPLDLIRLPREAPRGTDDTQMVLAPQPALPPTVTRDGVFGTHVASFGQEMMLLVPQLDLHLIVYLWGTRGNVWNANTTLMGQSAIPLREYSLQRHPTKWAVHSTTSGEKVSDVRLTYSVSTTPGPIENLVMTDVKETKIAFKWLAPANDHGSPVIGYRISLTTGDDADLDWRVLCDCTKLANPVYVLTNLEGNSRYKVNVQAVNKVGPGDEYIETLATSSVRPSPPSKPWIDEVRDGCLCVAWNPPTSDGGAAISAYKVRMKKSLGVTRYTIPLFGLNEADSKWVDMGTVGAAMNEQTVARPATYTAWVGPLEQLTCEYRFQIVAINRVGMSDGSPLGDAHYVA